ncbi:hypothetical protein J6590_059723 [Homalodisca vitripennis]|nr:hypothetical protein J6590_059723 [Homalodisca vitripennis]
MAWDWNQHQGAYDVGYDPYGYGWYPEEPTETEEEKQQREKEEKERIEAIQANRLFLKKVKKQCVLEDFVDLQRYKLFLFEVMIETLEVKGASTLGILSENEESRIAAKVQFLNSSFIEIYENPIERPLNLEETQHTDYFQNLSETKRKDIFVSSEGNGVGTSQEDERDQDFPVSRWENASGKSFLFSKTALELIQDLERYPVVVQVLRCNEDSTTCDPVGYARVRLPDDFSISIIQSCKEGVILPVTTVHKETSDIVNVFSVKKGQLEINCRLSCFGPVISTSFQSIDDYRQYVFKPSAMETTSKSEEGDSEANKRSEVLKPIVAEEEKTVGITVLRQLDHTFQLPVLWKSCTQESEDAETKKERKCGCKTKSAKNTKTVPEMSTLQLPQSSKTDLCRDVLPPTDQTDLRKFGKNQCDWHNLVSLEIKNSPGGNCGCLDERPQEIRKQTTDVEKDPSRVLKLERSSRVVTGIGIKLEREDCGCDCPLVKDTLRQKKLFLI